MTASNPKPSVMLIDDHDLFRAGLRRLLDDGGVHVCNDSAGDSDVVAGIEEFNPTVLLVETTAADGQGIALVEMLSRRKPEIPVAMLTMSKEPTDLYRSIRAGARGYILKDTQVPELAGAINELHRGLSWFSPWASNEMASWLRESQVPIQIPADMSLREVEVLRLVAKGLDNTEIAGELHISPKTVKNHVSNLLMKMGVSNRVQAAVNAVRSGIA